MVRAFEHGIINVQSKRCCFRTAPKKKKFHKKFSIICKFNRQTFKNYLKRKKKKKKYRMHTKQADVERESARTCFAGTSEKI